MTIDMSQFIGVFFDEAAEHLASMESLLLQLDLANPDDESLNAIFRAAHSIKGGAATFGFSDLADVTHILENLLDRLRRHELALQAVMVDVFLQAGDVLRSMLDAHRGQGEVDPAAVAAVSGRLEELAALQDAATEAPTPVLPDQAGVAGVSGTLHIAPQASVTRENLERSLAAHGVVHSYSNASPDGETLVGMTLNGTVEELLGELEFAIAPEHLRWQATNAADVDPGYGFFEPEVVQSDPGYGFFEPLAAKPAAEEGDGYGFFEPLPQPSRQTHEGDGFGFFVDPASLPAVATAPLEPAQQDTAPSVAPVSAAVMNEVASVPPPQKSNAAKTAASHESSIRVGVEKVDQLLNLVGELVITQSMLAQNVAALDPASYGHLISGVQQLERNTRELQESVMSIRMMPISSVFNRYPRLVHDLAAKLGKKVELRMLGEQTELDKGFIEKLSDPLTHLVRNSLDHGIEAPETRVARGKSETGTLTLKAFHQGGSIVIEVRDDGGGLNRERILAKARERGMGVSDSMPDSEVWQLIFEAGFSTAAEVTDVSGRGVGMDVVRRNIQSMGGRIDIESMLGVGSTISIRLPLTLAILDGMSIQVGEEIYIIPLSFIVESLQPAKDMVKTVTGQGRVINVRGEYLSLVALHEVFHVEPRITEYHQGLTIILEADGQKVALFVDDLLGQHQVVVKNLETNYRKVAGVAGATIMGDGRVAFILDVSTLVRLAQSRQFAAPELAHH
ncbi:chemotaxis protein CheW [Chitinilyticum piscinae]|uniref:Chemotaxis protein CheA n=1 Tax=Chitinilyticum piscinae TaxID=2866724 RepID=A0A8J7FGN0_9NEIS|nr:chemotaxis protein CheW [Chitinilyticum piscinae]MBE9608800.1 chemotaxis protein CheW [Chitinilyticum piscinae]